MAKTKAKSKYIAIGWDRDEGQWVSTYNSYTTPNLAVGALTSDWCGVEIVIPIAVPDMGSKTLHMSTRVIDVTCVVNEQLAKRAA